MLSGLLFDAHTIEMTSKKALKRENFLAFPRRWRICFLRNVGDLISPLFWRRNGRFELGIARLENRANDGREKSELRTVQVGGKGERGRRVLA